MKNIYGFKITDKKGNGLKRWFNSETELITDNPQGKLPNTLHSVNIAQNVMEFNEAFIYCNYAAIEHNLLFTVLEEKDWKAIPHPVKRFFNKLFKR
jgi:hypothetical protein